MLAGRIAADARADGFLVLAVRGDRLRRDLPFASLGAASVTWTAMHPDLATGPVHEALAGGDRGAVIAAVRELLEASAFGSPVLLVVDDVELLDADTADLVVFMMRHLRRHRVQVVLTARGDDAASGVGDDLRRSDAMGRLERLELGPFADDDLAALVTAHTGRQPDPTMVELIRARTGGLAFFATELTLALAGAGLTELTDGRVTTALSEGEPLPRRVATAVLHRVFQLGADARRVATTVALLGQVPVERLPVLASVTGLTPERAEEAFDRLIRARVLSDDGSSFGFSHAIVRDALDADLGPAARRALHGALSRALAGADGPVDPTEVGAHVRAGPGGRDPSAAELLVAAGDAVLDTAPADSAGWYRDALARLSPLDPAVMTTQLRLSRALDLSAQHDEAARVATAARPGLTRRDDRTLAVLVTAHAAFALGHLDRAADVLDAALAEDVPRPARLVLARAQVHSWLDDEATTARSLAEAEALGLAPDDPMALAIRLNLVTRAGDTAGGARIATQLRHVAEVAPATATTSVALAVSWADAFALDPADALGRRPAADAAGPAAGWSRSAAAWAGLRLGRLAEAVADAEAARSGIDPAVGDLLVGVCGAVLVVGQLEQGDQDAAEAALAWARRVPIRAVESALDWAEARTAAVRGHWRRAAEILDDAVRREESLGRVDVTAMLLAERVDVAAAAGDADAAGAANRRLQAMPRDDDGIAMAMWCLMADAVVTGDPAAAEAAHAHAARHGLALDAARALVLGGRSSGEVRQLIDAHDELGRLGAVARQRQVASELRAGGHRVPQGRRSVARRLSAVDLEVAGLVAAGLTNRQVAERMNLSPKTIEVYLSRIYAKTGCRSRVELAVAVRAGTLATTA